MFKLHLENFVIDDIPIYSLNSKAHEDHLREVLQTLREKQLYTKFNKCEFWIKSVTFFGHVIFKNGVLTDPKKVESILNWPKPTNVFEE